MADLAVVAANVQTYSDARTVVGLAGVAITAGQVVCYDFATATFKLARATKVPPFTTIYGVALNNAAAGQPLTVLRGGGFNPGVAMPNQGLYVLSGNNDGGIAPAADIGGTWNVAILGVAVTTTRLQLAVATPVMDLPVPMMWLDFSISFNAGLCPLT